MPVKVKTTEKEDEATAEYAKLCESTRALIAEAEGLLCLGKEFSGKPCEISVQFLTDGTTSGYKDYVDLFVSGPIGKSSKDVVFKSLPVTQNMVTYDEPLVLIADDNEIDQVTAGRLSMRAEKTKALTFPVIVFSDGFFVLRKGEGFSYAFIIEALERVSGTTVMAFRRSDISIRNEYVKSYAEYIGSTLALMKMKKCIEDAFVYLDELAEYYSQVGDNAKESAFKRLVAITGAKSICRFVRDNLIPIYNKINDKTDEWLGVLVKLRERYDRHIDRLVMDTPVSTDSPFALNLDLKYGVFRSQIKSFIEDIKSSSLYGLPNGILEHPTEQYVDETEKKISSKTSELSLLGTFSSGKTTMINTLLGHEKKLRTSMGHNTAVLMNIRYKGESGSERYDIIYKNHVVWNLIKPNSFDKDIVNPFGVKAKVIRIEKNSGKYIITLLKSGERGEDNVKKIEIRGGVTLDVSENDVIEPCQSLVKRNYSKDKLLIASKRELETILDYVGSKKLSNLKITYFTDGSSEDSMFSGIIGGSHKEESRVISGEKAVVFIKTLLKYEVYSASKGSTQPIVNSDKVFAHMKSRIIKAVFEADVGLKDNTVILDENGWLGLCGNTEIKDNSSPNSNEAFSESPACYMFVSRLDLYLNSEFLENCTVNDTPGFGSVTEEHDACTERFVSTNKGRLLVMISVNSKPRDAKLEDLLNYLTNIYKDFHKDRIDEVYFMLNTFLQSTAKSNLEKACKGIASDLIQRGFVKNNIFVCDLKSAIDGGQHMRTMFGMPSYDVFKKKCITEMVEAGICRKFLSIYDQWTDFFKNNANSIDDKIVNLRQALIDGERRIRELRESIRDVKNTEIKSIDGVLEEARDDYNYYYTLIDTTFCSNNRGAGFLLLKRQRQAECRNVINQIRGLIGNLGDYAETIKRYGDDSLAELDNIIKSRNDSEEVPEPDEGIFTLAIENIAAKLNDADEFTRAWNKKDKTYSYMSAIQSMIDEDYEQSAKRARDYYSKLKRQFDKRKKNILSSLEREMRQIESPELIKEEIVRLEEVLSDLEKYKKLFAKSVNTKGIRRG